jgi:IclR family pca regulon transcriptional regulator
VAVLGLGAAAMQGHDLVRAAQATLGGLAERTGETVNLGVLVSDQVLFVSRVERPYALVAANIRVGSVVPAVFSSIGKVLLAFLEPEDFNQRISRRSFSGEWGPQAVRSIPELRKQLAVVREQGYIIQQEEAMARLSSVAAPIFQSGNQVVAAANIAVLASEYDVERIEGELKAPLVEACDEVSRRLGGVPRALAAP